MARLEGLWQHLSEMLTSITIKNFRTLVDVTIPMRPLTIFIGPNNSGKTNAIRAIQKLTSTAGIVEPNAVTRWADSLPYSIEATALFGTNRLGLKLVEPTRENGGGAATLQLEGSTTWKAEVTNRKSQALAPSGQGYHFNSVSEFFRESFVVATREFPGARAAMEFFQRARVASLSVPVLRAPSPISKEPQLGERGENFGSVLDWISGQRPALFRSINEELRRVLGVDGCTTLVTDEGMKIPAIIEGDRSFGADVISDGVLLYMGLTTAAHLVGPRSLLMIEEPENGIHPRRLKALLDQIRALNKSGTQVLLTTHSPILLDEFSDEPESIVVFDRDQNGTRVSQPSPERLKQVLSGDFGLGSLWYSGAIGGVPT